MPHSLLRHTWALSLCCGALLIPPAAQAGALTVSSSGTFSAATPTSFFSAPGASWTLSFVIDAEPVPITTPPGVTESGEFTTVPFSDFVFTLGGVAVAATPSYVTFYSNTGGSGGVDVYFNDVVANPLAPIQAMTFFGPQLYTGDEFDPTFIAGSYTTFLPGAGGVIAIIDDISYAQASTTLVLAPVPAPPSVVLAALALGLVAAARRRSEPVAAVAV
jgi:hypothetical protein